MPLLQSDETITPDQIKALMGIIDGEITKTQSNEPEPYMTLKEVSRKLNISRCTLWRWGVPGYDLGGRRRFKISEVDAYLHSDEFRQKAEELKRERRQK